jgi:methylthioribose-1-phosphate isomerase
LAGASSGRPPEQHLRLTAWLMTLPKRPTVFVTDRTLAERLRSQSLQHSQVGKFRRLLEQHFEVAKQLGLLKDFKPPTTETAGKWLIKLL